MRDTILIGEGREFRRAPETGWRDELALLQDAPSPRLAFMSEEHHLVRDTVVIELPRYGAPLPPALVAAKTGLREARVKRILDELEAGLFFLVRNGVGDVSWAFPVTSETTPHRVRLASGEQVFAA